MNKKSFKIFLGIFIILIFFVAVFFIIIRLNVFPDLTKIYNEFIAKIISDGGLVGSVSYVGENYAKITAIINDDANVSAKFSSTSDVCIVHGDLKEYDSKMLKVSDISISANVKEGDMLLTSHISDKYVSGILIGLLIK